MLMTMVVWLLDQMFSQVDWFTRLAYVFGYVFLSIISIGFGFGFYWKVLESRSEAARSAESAVGQVQSSLYGASTRLEQLQATLVQLSAMSTDKAAIERDKGTSCPNSSPGDGPRRKMRDEDAARFNFASQFVKGRVTAIKGDMGALDTELAKIVSNDASTIDAVSGTRNDFMRSLGRRLDMTVTGFNAFRTDPQLRQIRTDLADRAERTTIDMGNGKIHHLPRQPVAGRPARRRARDRSAAYLGEARDRCRRRLGSDHRSFPPPDSDLLRSVVVRASAVRRRVAPATTEGRAVDRQPGRFARAQQRVRRPVEARLHPARRRRVRRSVPAACLHRPSDEPLCRHSPKHDRSRARAGVSHPVALFRDP